MTRKMSVHKANITRKLPHNNNKNINENKKNYNDDDFSPISKQQGKFLMV